MEDITDEFRNKQPVIFGLTCVQAFYKDMVSCTDEEGKTSTSTTPVFTLVESNTLSEDTGISL